MLDITPGAIPQVINVSESDINRGYTVTLMNEKGVFEIPSGTTAKLEGTGANNFSESAAVRGNTVVFDLTESMTAKAGDTWTKIKLTKDGKPVSTCAFILRADRGLEAGTVTDAKGFETLVHDAVETVMDEKGFVIDSTLSVPGAAADAAATGDRLSDISEPTVNLCNVPTGRWYARSADGEILESSENYVGMHATVPCKASQSYGVAFFETGASSTSRVYVTWYDSAGGMISSQSQNRAGVNFGYVFTSPENAASVHVSAYNSNGINESAKIEIVEGDSFATEYTPPYTAYDAVARASGATAEAASGAVSVYMHSTADIRWRSASAEIALLGDSIVQGVGSSDYAATGDTIATIGGTTYKRNVGVKAWAAQFKTYVEGSYYGLTVVNNGLPGQGISEITDNLDSLVSANTVCAIVCVGVNNRSSGATTIMNYYVDLFNALKAKGIPVLALSPIDVNGASGSTSMGLINTALERACVTCGVPYFNLYGKFNTLLRTNTKADYYNDTLHPNDKGHGALFGMICELLGF